MTLRRKKLDLTFYIDAYSKKGSGLGTAKLSDDRHCRVEVPFTMEGDTIKASVVKKRSQVYKGHLEEILHPSPQRIQPKCIHFGSCGGCKWQMIPYDEQLKIKEQGIRAAFLQAKIPLNSFRPIIAAKSHWQYRNKMEFSFSSDRKGEKYLGLILQDSKGKVFNLTECHLVNSWFAQSVKTVKKWWDESGLLAYHPPSNRGSLRTLTVREGKTSSDKLIMLTVSGNPDYALNKWHLDSFVAYLRAAIEADSPLNELSVFLRIQQTAKGKPTEFYEMHLFGPEYVKETLAFSDELKLNFKISPSAFFQPNTEQAEIIYQTALEMVNITSDMNVYDLYCGTGTLGICAARKAKKVIGIELSPESSLDARENVKENGLTNVEILTGDVGQLLQQMKESKHDHPDLVMLDPPRTGLSGEAIEQICLIKPKQILYISCNPQTQAQDVEKFLNFGYEVVAIQPIDQFPHTPHVENITVLK